MASTSIQQRSENSSLSKAGDWSPEDINTLRQTVARDCSDSQFKLFCQVVGRTGLDPFARQIYGIVRQGVMSIQVGIDGFRVMAQRTGQYAGQVGPEWCGPDGCWRDVWLSTTPPAAARVGVLRTGFAEPVWGVATFSEYNAKGPMWSKMPANQLAKCAEAQALRKAFPAELSGLYANEEMEQADSGKAAPEASPRPSVKDKLRKTVGNTAAAPEPVIEQRPEIIDEPSPFSGDEPVEPKPAAAPDVDWSDFRAFVEACEARAQDVGMQPAAFEALKSEMLAKTGKESWMQVSASVRKRFWEVIGERAK